MKRQMVYIVGALLFALIFAAIALPSTGVFAECGNLHTTDLATWDLSQTRATGHNELVDGGLRIYTEGNTGTDKAAGYYPLAVDLSSFGSPTIDSMLDYTITFGIEPGLQIATDFDHNGTFDGYLVGEAVYGSGWWLSNSAAQFAKDGAPHNGGGYGSQWYGTLSEWSTSFPGARTLAIGYSLGSGVYADGVIVKMTFGCNTYTFDDTPPATPEMTAEPTGEVTAEPPMEPTAVYVAPVEAAGMVCRIDLDQPVNPPMYVQHLEDAEWSGFDGWIAQVYTGDHYDFSIHSHAGQALYGGFYRVIGNNLGERRYFEVTNPGVCVEVEFSETGANGSE